MSTGILWLDWVIALAVVALIGWARVAQGRNESRPGRVRTLTFADGSTAEIENASARYERLIVNELVKMKGPVTADREEMT